MVEVTAIVKNGMGIHCRPSAVIVKETMEYPGEIVVIAESGSCDPRSILNLIALGLGEGTAVTLRVSGEDEEAFARKLVALFERHFDFPPREDGMPPGTLPGEIRTT